MTGVPGIMALARALSLPDPVLGPLERAAHALPELPLRDLASPDKAEETWKALASRIPVWKRDNGMAQLAVSLAAAVHTRRAYRERGISEDIFLATMDCFRRFLEETHAILNRWVFDRGFWTWRQTGCLLFRLGTLEFEYCAPGKGERRPGTMPDAPVWNVHIPSGAVLTREALDHSYARAWRFAAGFRNRPRAMLCGSWLLSPALEDLLPERSSIRRFAADYARYAEDPDDTQFYRWLFHSAVPLPAEDLPERTSLQRGAKALLVSGGKIGMACGIFTP